MSIKCNLVMIIMSIKGNKEQYESRATNEQCKCRAKNDEV